jgi:phosphoglycerate kinase
MFGPATSVRTQKEGAGMMKTIRDVEISEKRLLIRVDFNVPLDEYQNITDDARIRAVLPTIRYALDHNAMVILASHLGRPKGEPASEFSLKPVAKRLGRLLGQDVAMASDCVGEAVREQVKTMEPGDVLLLENLRFHPEEQKNDDDFGKALADLCDIYVNDAFAVSHRVNASVVSVTRFAAISVAGFLLQKELDYFAKAMKDPRRPLVAIVGGAKVSSKLKAMENMLDHVDKLIVGGAMANTFLKRNGLDVGKSKVEEDLLEAAGALMKRAAERGVRVYLPVDVVAASRFAADAESMIVPAAEIPHDWMALDIGPATSLLFGEALHNAKTIIWNGPMGVFEMDAFSRGTLRMVHAVADSYALTIVGGGDTDVAVHKAGEVDRISYISTGGGAFLTLMEGKSLPAVRALDAANGASE